MAGTLDRCPLNRGVRLIGVSVKRGSTVYIYIYNYSLVLHLIAHKNSFSQTFHSSRHCHTFASTFHLHSNTWFISADIFTPSYVLFDPFMLKPTVCLPYQLDQHQCRSTILYKKSVIKYKIIHIFKNSPDP